MRKCTLIIVVMLFSIYMFGCGKKKEASLVETQEPMSMEALGTLSIKPTTVPESKAPVVQALPVSQPKPEPLPPPGPYKPTVEEIQAALKNAGFYTGAIDGKKGPLTQKAIEEFQKANGLEVDGKVGPKTWSVLSKHLNPAPATPMPGEKR